MTNNTKNQEPTPEFLRGSRPTMSKDEAAKILKDLNPDKIIKDNEEKMTDAILQSMSNDRASREPLPGAVNDAFDITDDITIQTSEGDVTIRKMKTIDITIFKLTDSPFYKLIMGDLKEKGDVDKDFKAMFPDEELIYLLIYQFTHPAKEIYRMVKKNKELYKETATEEVGTKFSPADTLVLIESIMKHIGLVHNAKVDFQEIQSEQDVNDDLKKNSM